MDPTLDVYFLHQYALLYEEQEKGKAEIYRHTTDFGEIYYVFIKRIIPSNLTSEKIYDVTTPYGYGGPIILDCIPGKEANLVKSFTSAWNSYCAENRIISEFVRFHPLIKNYELFKSYYFSEFNRPTVCIDLSLKNAFDREVTSKCRNMVRKAEKKGVKIAFDFQGNSVDDFYQIYIATMNQKHASMYYYFSKQFFTNMVATLPDNCFFVHASVEDVIISSAMFLYSDEFIHYHFSGTAPSYYNLAANNLILASVIFWGEAHGKKKLHLGGGFSSDTEDPLYLFKKSFSKSAPHDFYTGKKIHNLSVYKKLCKAHGVIKGLSFFPEYRAEI